MAHWLQSVNNLLHKLDDTVENVAEDRAITVQPGQGKDAVDSILAKRGILDADNNNDSNHDTTDNNSNHDDDDDDDDKYDDYEEDEYDEEEVYEDDQEEEVDDQEEVVEFGVDDDNDNGGEEDGWDNLDVPIEQTQEDHNSDNTTTTIASEEQKNDIMEQQQQQQQQNEIEEQQDGIITPATLLTTDDVAATNPEQQDDPEIVQIEQKPVTTNQDESSNDQSQILMALESTQTQKTQTETIFDDQNNQNQPQKEESVSTTADEPTTITTTTTTTTTTNTTQDQTKSDNDNNESPNDPSQLVPQTSSKTPEPLPLPAANDIKPTPTLTKMMSLPSISKPLNLSTTGKSTTPKAAPTPSAPPPPVRTYEKEYKQALSREREAQKEIKKLEKGNRQAVSREKEAQREARTLRRHVVTLNSELESAESEVGPLRDELERAGARLDKDRQRHKDEMDAIKKRHADEIAVLKQQQTNATKDIQARSNGQLEEMRKQVRDLEEKRAQEGGDWSKEIESTMQRELQMSRKVSLLEDEKSTLLAQISTLQAQSDHVQNRLDSISQTADNAMLREREAEDKLDQAMSLHARQLNQRQAREGELERAIADLSAALTKAGNGGVSSMTYSDSNDSRNHMESIKDELSGTQEELETTKVQLEAQNERVKMMQQELRDMSKERNVEAAATRSKQLQFDRQAAEMSLQISRLQASLRDAQKATVAEPMEGADITGDDQTPAGHVNELTREVVRLQGRLGQSASEVKALKSRLQSAVDRANRAEQAVVDMGDPELGSPPASGNSDGGLVRRRRKRGTDTYESIRSSLLLNNVEDENAKRIGKAIDVIDRISVDTGKYLRYNPLARGGFILYLAFLHFWTFAVLFFHTHRFETVHGDFGAKYPHGPHAMMHHEHPVDPLVPKIRGSNSEMTEQETKASSIVSGDAAAGVSSPAEGGDEANGAAAAKDTLETGKVNLE